MVAIGQSVDATNPLFGGAEEPDMPGAVFPSTPVVATGAAAAAAAIAAASSEPVQHSTRTTFVQPQAEEPVALASASAEPPLDFSLDVDTALGRADESLEFSPDVRHVVEAPPVVEKRAATALEEAVEGRFELPSLDFGNDSAASRETVEVGSASVLSAEPAPVGVPASKAAAATAFGGDAGGINFDLPSFDELNLGAGKAEAVASTEPASLDFNVSSGSDDGSPQWQEMATKLDLASAYEEIGDKDGARELLEEVVRDGDGDQKRKAQAMLAAIG